MIVNQESLISHIENYLGKIERACTRTSEGKDLSFHILKCTEGQVSDTKAFCTIRLGSHCLPSKTSDKVIHHELVMMVPSIFPDSNIPALLQQLGSFAIQRNSAYLRGEVVGGTESGAIFKDKPFTAFYVATPNALPEQFATYPCKDGQSLVFAWLIPITTSEAHFVRTHGWEKFEDLLADRNADMVDLRRSSYV